LRGEFVPPVFHGGVQIETGLIFHNCFKRVLESFDFVAAGAKQLMR
jgi:hypothetical protein